jgi:hypothetical protein
MAWFWSRFDRTGAAVLPRPVMRPLLRPTRDATAK